MLVRMHVHTRKNQAGRAGGPTSPKVSSSHLGEFLLWSAPQWVSRIPLSLAFGFISTHRDRIKGNLSRGCCGGRKRGPSGKISRMWIAMDVTEQWGSSTVAKAAAAPKNLSEM